MSNDDQAGGAYVSWSAAEDEILLAWIRCRLTYSQISEALQKNGYVRSVKAITGRVRTRGFLAKAGALKSAKPEPPPPAPKPAPKPLPADLDVNGVRDARGMVWPALSGWGLPLKRIPLSHRYGRGPE